MSKHLKPSLATLVIFHFVLTFVHGAAHGGASVALTPVAFAFVIAVIQLGPVAGLILTRFSPRGGAALVTACMAGALVFGVVNHFVLPGADHVAHVAGRWRLLFTWTAVLLALSEAAGTVVGTAVLREYARQRA